MDKPIPISEVRGKTIPIRGLIHKDGRSRTMVALGDSLIFTLADPSTMTSVLQKSTAAGDITADDTGTFQFRIDANESHPNQLPLNYYWYEIEITEGDTGHEYLILKGPWTWQASPNV